MHTCSDSESVLSIDVDMPLSIRLPKVRRKESKRHSSAAASAGSGGGGDGDAASLASAMSASTNSVKSLGLAREFFKILAKSKFYSLVSSVVIRIIIFCSWWRRLLRPEGERPAPTSPSRLEVWYEQGEDRNQGD